MNSQRFNIKYHWHFIVFILISFFYLSSFYHRYTNEDEAIIASHSYFFNKLGYVKCDIYAGYGQNWEIRQYHYHKLFVLMGALFMNIFGFNIYSFRSVSLLFAIIFFLYTWLYTLKFIKDRPPGKYLVILISLLLFNSLFFDHSFMFRPEIMLMAIGFGSFYYLKVGLENQKIQFIILAGILAGLATFTHLNGLIYCCAGLFLLLWRKRYQYAIVFSLFAGIFSLLYFFDIHSLEELNALYIQFITDPNIVDKPSMIISLLNEQMRFFWSPAECIFSALFFLSLWFGFKRIKAQHTDLLIYLIALVVSLGLLAHGKTTKYALNYYPYMALVIVSFIFQLNEFRKPIRLIFFGLILIYIGIHGFFNIDLIRHRINIEANSTYIAGLLPEKNVKISAPSVFVFNQITNFTIRGEIAFWHHYAVFHRGVKETTKEYFSFAKEHGDKYVVIDKKTNALPYLVKENFDRLNPGDTLYGFKLILKKENRIFIFKDK